MIVRKPSSQFTTSSASSRNSSLYPSSALTEGWDADDEDTMSTSTPEEVAAQSRPLSVAIPKIPGAHGPYCPRRPNLKEILANTSPAPWTLTAFMAYLSSNHCLETLEFTMDSGRYKKHYAKMMARAVDGKPPARDREYVQLLWARLVDAYIRPNGSREVNLPANIRDPILNFADPDMPPAPEKLDPAVAQIYELMEESVLGPFLNSAYPQMDHPTVASAPVGNISEESIPTTARTHQDRSSQYRRSRTSRESPPPRTAVEPHSYSYSPPSAVSRRSAPSQLATAMNKARFSVKLSPTTSAPAAANFSTTAATTSGGTTSSGSDLNLSGSNSGPGMTDDSGSTGSPTNESPMTPPTSPPMSDVGASPRISRDSGMWKKLGRLSGMKMNKKRSKELQNEEQ